MKNIHYITYNDTYNGIYQSQVIDVVNYLNKTFDVSVQLIAFVPVRLWKDQKRVIKLKLPSAKVFPILGSLDKVDRTAMFFYLISKKINAICRGALAFTVAENYYSKIVYDGRAAVEAEVTEYEVTGSVKIDKILIDAENKAIRNADYFISVSSKLIKYWEEKLKRTIPSSKYSLIPCTFTGQVDSVSVSNTFENVRIVYSGGTGGWQSFEKVVSMLDALMQLQDNVEVLFLTKENSVLNKLMEKYPNRSNRMWLSHSKVYEALQSCDYGILLREDKITNRVASPVKFAEYLNAGLKVLISPNIGDFSLFTKEHNCGLLVENELPTLSKVSQEEKEFIKSLCVDFFQKNSKIITEQYDKLVNVF